MIQRIQTVYLLLAAAIVSLFFFLPLGHFLGDVQQYVLTATGLRTAEGGVVSPTQPMKLMAVIAVVMPLLTIFIYKRRQRQLRFCYASMAALAGLQVMACIYLWSFWHVMQGFEIHAARLSAGAVAPIVAFVPVWMAMRAIRRDEEKVRSIDRIR